MVKKEEAKVCEVICKLNKIKKKQEQLKKIYEKGRKYIISTLTKSKFKEFQAVNEEDEVISALVYETNKVTYDLQKIKDNIPKEQHKLIIEKSYSVNEDKLKELIKKGIIKKSIAKQFIIVSESLNKESLEHYVSKGDINIEDLEGTYTTVKINNLKITRKEKVKE